MFFYVSSVSVYCQRYLCRIFFLLESRVRFVQDLSSLCPSLSALKSGSTERLETDPLNAGHSAGRGHICVTVKEHLVGFGMSGQSITDRITAAQHSVTGSAISKTVCKATTHEIMGPKKKHLDCKYFILFISFVPKYRSTVKFF